MPEYPEGRTKGVAMQDNETSFFNGTQYRGNERKYLAWSVVTLVITGLIGNIWWYPLHANIYGFLISLVSPIIVGLALLGIYQLISVIVAYQLFRRPSDRTVTGVHSRAGSHG
jgi:hypothetical protein